MAIRPSSNLSTVRTQSEAYDATKDNAQDFNEQATILAGHADDIEANAAAIALKVTAVAGKDLSDNNFSDSYKSQLDNAPADINDSLSDKADAATVAAALAGKADLVEGKIPASQLPAGIDEVQEYANLAAFPATGVDSVIYLAIDTNTSYRWGGTVYAQLDSGLALGETSATAYRGDRGKTAYDHSQVVHNKALVGLGNVDNTSDLNKPISTATQAALDLKATLSTLTKSDVGLSNVENKSSATIRSEITSSDIPVEIARVTDIPTDLADLATDANNQRVSSTEKDAWNSYSVIGATTLTPGATLDMTGHSVPTMTLTGNLTVTAVTNIPAGGVVIRCIHGGYTLSILGKSDFIDQDGEYLVRLVNFGTTASQVLRVFDAVGGGLSAPSGLGAFSASNITLSGDGYYNDYTPSANVVLTFPTTGHSEGAEKYVRVTLNGTYTLSVQPAVGQTISVTGFTNGAAPTAGTYMMSMKYKSQKVLVELKSIADIQSIVLTSYDFDGTLTTYLDLVNTQSAILTIEQTSSELRATVNNTNGTTANVDKLTDKLSADGACSFAIDFLENTRLNSYNCYFGFRIDANNFALLYQKDSGGNGILYVRNTGGIVRAVDVGTALWGKRWKIDRDSAHRWRYYYWNVDQWTEVDAAFDKTCNIGTTVTPYWSPWIQTSGIGTGYLRFDRWRFTNAAYTTELPA